MVDGNATCVSIQRRIVGNVVAAEHRKRRNTGAATLVKCLGQECPRGGKAIRRDKVGTYVGVGSVELARDRIQDVPVAGNGQADEASLRISQRGTDRSAVVRCVVVVADRADHTGRLAVMAALHHGVKPILSRQQILHIAGAKTDAGDTPLVGNARAGKVVEVNGLMRAVKVACADMNDTPLKGRPVIGWHVDSL
jgi:hypothetical protein